MNSEATGEMQKQKRLFQAIPNCIGCRIFDIQSSRLIGDGRANREAGQNENSGSLNAMFLGGREMFRIALEIAITFD
jgi:hypothetical protein